MRATRLALEAADLLLEPCGVFAETRRVGARGRARFLDRHERRGAVRLRGARALD